MWSETDESLGQFLFFGCWNKDGCTDPSGPEAAVAAAVRARPERFLLIGGDNVYPDVIPSAVPGGKATKVHPVPRVEQGFRCISAPQHQILAALGNHNITESPTIRNEHARLHRENLIFLPDDYYMRIFHGDKKALIVLDTNTVGDEHAAMLDWFVHSLNRLAELGIYQYYLVQHEPFVSYKADGARQKNQVLKNGTELLDILVQFPPAMILVADTHNYQLGIITYKGRKLIQVVSGTGGADLDDVGIVGGPIENFPGTYEVLDSAVAYGYQVVRDYSPAFVNVRSSNAESL